MRLILAIFSTLLLFQEDGKEFWKFKAGTEWTFKRTEGDKKGKTVMKVTEVKDDKVFLTSEDTNEGEKEPEKTEHLAFAFEDGLIKLQKIEDGEAKPFLNLLKVGSKKGDKWKSPMLDAAGMEVEIENQGTEDIKVGEETYKNAVHCHFAFGDKDQGMEGTADYYLAPNAGMLKFKVTMKGGGEEGQEFSLELQKFTAGK